MTQPKKFKFLLDGDDTINAPDGWLKTTIKYQRSAKYGGLVRSTVAPYGFKRGAATYLRTALYTEGISSRRYLEIQKQTPKTWQYRRLFYGRIDFTSAKDSENAFEVAAIEKTIAVQVDAYEDTDFAFPLVGDDVIDVTLPPIALNETADFIAVVRDDFSAQDFPGLTLVTNQQLANKASAQQVDYDQVTTPDFTTSPHWFFQATVDTVVRIQAHIVGLASSPGGGTYEMNIYRSDQSSDTTPVYTFISVTLSGGINVPINLNQDFTLSVLAGQRLFFFMRHVDGAGGVSEGFAFSEQTTFMLSYTTASPASMCKAISAYNLYQRLIAIINRGETPVIAQSVLLANEFKYLYYTCSNSILTSQIDNIYQSGETLQQGARYKVIAAVINYYLPNGTAHTFNIGDEFEAVIGKDSFTSPLGGFVRQLTSVPSIIISFKNFFKDIFGLKGGQACFGVENYAACLENLSFAYRSATVLDLGKSISDFTVSPNLERAYNTIKTGQNDQQYDAINGQMEAASEQNWKIARDIIKKELDITVASRYDPYGIEQIRAIPANVYGNTAASRSDNDVFMLWLRPALDMPLTVAEGCTSWANIGGDYYNWPLSPKQNLLRGGRFLHSCLYGLDGSQITLTSGLKNTAMITVSAQFGRVAESEPIDVSSLGALLFIPYIFSFECKQDNDAGILLADNPFGLIRAEYLEIPINGYVQEVSTDEATNSTQKFEIEAGAGMSMASLIR